MNPSGMQIFIAGTLRWNMPPEAGAACLHPSTEKHAAIYDGGRACYTLNLRMVAVYVDMPLKPIAICCCRLGQRRYVPRVAWLALPSPMSSLFWHFNLNVVFLAIHYDTWFFLSKIPKVEHRAITCIGGLNLDTPCLSIFFGFV
jgi:hypothetical protein